MSKEEQRLPHIPLEEAASKEPSAYYNDRRLDGLHYEAEAQRWTSGNGFIAAFVTAEEQATPPEADLFIPLPIVTRARREAKARNQGRYNWGTKYRAIVEYIMPATPTHEAAAFAYEEAGNKMTLQPARPTRPPDYSAICNVLFPWMISTSAEEAAAMKAAAEAAAQTPAPKPWEAAHTLHSARASAYPYPKNEAEAQTSPPRVLLPAFTVEARALYQSAKAALDTYDHAQELTTARAMYCIQILAETGKAAYHWRPQHPDLPYLDYSMGGPPRVLTLDAAGWTPNEEPRTRDLVVALDSALLYRLARAVQEPQKTQGRGNRHNFPVTVWYDPNVPETRHAAYYVTPGDIEAAYSKDPPAAYGAIMPIALTGYYASRDFRG